MSDSSGIRRASIVSALGTGGARVAGAARDIAIGHVFGAGRAADAFWVAWTVPSVFRRFVADEGLTGALIPAVAQTERSEGAEEAKRLADGALLALLLASTFIVVFGILTAPYLVQAFAHGYSDEPEKMALTVRLTRWLFPFVVFVSLVSYCEGLLNYRGHFFIPKIAPGIVSTSVAASALFFVSRFEEPIMALAIGMLVGGLVHFLVCVPPLIKHWGAPRPSLRGFRSPRFGTFLREMGKVVLIGIMAQLNVVLLRLLATTLEEGSVTQYWYANRVVDLAQGVIAVAVGSALLPVVARDAAAKNWDSFRKNFYQAVMLVAVFLVPAAVLLASLAEPIVAILFRHGNFDAASAGHSIDTLRLLVPFMLSLAGINIIKKVYFALDDRTTLLLVGGFGLLLTAALGYGLSQRMGVEGLGVTLSVSGTAQLIAYLVLIRRKADIELRLGKLLGPLGKLLLASLPAGAAAYAICLSGNWSLGPASLLNWVLFVAAGIVGIVLYLAVGLVLQVEQLQSLMRRFRRRS